MDLRIAAALLGGLVASAIVACRWFGCVRGYVTGHHEGYEKGYRAARARYQVPSTAHETLKAAYISLNQEHRGHGGECAICDLLAAVASLIMGPGY